MLPRSIRKHFLFVMYEINSILFFVGVGKSSNNSSRSGWSGRKCQTLTDWNSTLFLQLYLARDAASRTFLRLWQKINACRSEFLKLPRLPGPRKV